MAANRPGTKRLTETEKRRAECWNQAEHVLGPPGYLEWYEWATKMAETHVQEKCPGCGLYCIWRKA